MRTFRAIAMVALCTLGACAGTPSSEETVDTDTGGTTTPPAEREAFAPPRAELPTELPAGTLAMEVLSWGTLADELGRDLAALARRADPEMAELQESLRAQGLRLVRLDAADVGALFELAPPSGAVRRRIVLPSTRYEDVVEGATIDEQTAVDTPLGVRRVGPGGARIAVRIWASPEADGTLHVRADVVGVVGEPVRDGRRELLSGTRQRRLSGRPIPGLAAHLVARTDEAWALIAAPPDEVWQIRAVASPDPAMRPQDPARQEAAVGAVGPRVEPLRTSGETLFARVDDAGALNELDAAARLVVLFVARAPERFTLFPDVPSVQ